MDSDGRNNDGMRYIVADVKIYNLNRSQHLDILNPGWRRMRVRRAKIGRVTVHDALHRSIDAMFTRPLPKTTEDFGV